MKGCEEQVKERADYDMERRAKHLSLPTFLGNKHMSFLS